MAPPRTVMRQTDDTVSSGLQQLLASERAFVTTLRSLDAQLAQRLRFCGPRNVDPTLDQWLGYMRQLAALHAFYQLKLQRAVEDASTNMSQIESVVEDLLLVTRAVYAPLHVRRRQFKDAMDALLRRKAEDTVRVFREFLQQSKRSTQQLVALPLQHLSELLERVDIIVGSRTLTQTCEETKQFLATSERDAQQEMQLIELHARLRGSPLEMDLCGRGLLCRTHVTLMRTGSGAGADDRGLVFDQTAQPLHEVFCLGDGTVLFLEKTQEEGGVTAPAAGLCINLKNDAVFQEFVPRSLGDVVHAMVLVGPSSSLLVSLPRDSSLSDFHVFVDCVSTQLTHNETRKQQLKTGRSVDELALPDDLHELLQSPQRPLVAFPCFHDDELPGVFWLQDKTSANLWRFVELVQCGPFLLAFAVSGWRHHRLVARVDLSQPTTSMAEEPRTDDNWSLQITSGQGEGSRLDMVSERRARVDFWSDQLVKAIEAAAEREKAEARAAKAAAAEAEAAKKAAAAAAPAVSSPVENDSFINVRAKKHQRNSTSAVSNPSLSTSTEVSEVAVKKVVSEEPAAKPTSAKKRKFSKVSAVDEAVGANESVSTTGPGDPSSEHTQPEAASTARLAGKRQRTPPVKTPKQRWLRRKSDDPDDKHLETTQPGAQDAIRANPSVEEPASEPPAATDAIDGSSAAAPSIRIIFTGIEPTPKTFKKISAIPGAAYEEDIERATHVLAPKNTLRRTVKLLCGISICDHILDERWLEESARARTAVYERQYCLKDAKAEAKWGFDLVKTMYDTPSAQRRRLFEGCRFFITPHKTVLPPVQDLVKIVEQAGGQVAITGAPQDADLVITSEGAAGTAAIAKLLSKTETVYTPELILSSILQQRLDPEQHKLQRTPSRGRRA